MACKRPNITSQQNASRPFPFTRARFVCRHWHPRPSARKNRFGSAVRLWQNRHNNAMQHEPATSARTIMSLEAYQEECGRLVFNEDSPPILGLVPMPQADCDRIGALVAEEISRGRFISAYDVLVGLLRLHPAAVSLWLARLAGKAYDAGAFWDEFGRMAGVTVGVDQRKPLATSSAAHAGIESRISSPPPLFHAPTWASSSFRRACLSATAQPTRASCAPWPTTLACQNQTMPTP